MFLFIAGIILTLVLFVVAGYSGNGGVRGFHFKPTCFISFIGIVIMAASCIKSVPTGHTGIITVFGKVEARTLDAGIHVLLPWENVVAMDNRIQKVSVDMESTTSDMQTVNVKFTLNYQISKTNASEIYKTIGTEYEKTVVDPQVTNTVKAVLAKYAAIELVSDRNGVSTMANNQLKSALSKYNIEVVDTSIENLGFTEEFNSSIEKKVIAEQELEKAQTEQAKLNLEVEQAAKRKVTEAQGIADANAILSNSYTPEILQKMFIDKWNGTLPNVVGSTGSVIDVSSYAGTASSK